LKWVNAGAVVGLVFLIYGTQRKIWRLDMQGREQPTVRSEPPLLEKTYVPAEECTY
jgi:hypothetical protein